MYVQVIQMLWSDASLSGWGCACEGITAGDQWFPVDKYFYINYLELQAAFFALKWFRAKQIGMHVRLMLDNTTAVPCINNMGIFSLMQ